MLKTFHYCFSDPCITRSISVDTIKCPTINDLIIKIASDLHIEKYHIEIKNMPTENKLSSLKDNYEFKIELKFQKKDISFKFPNGKIIIIKNSYKMSFNDVIQSFQNDGFYFSPKFIKNNFHIMKSNNEISSNDDFPFFTVSYANSVKVETSGDFITINYDKKQFFFTENEYAWDAKSFIFNFFPEIRFPIFIFFSDASTGKNIDSNHKLKHDEEYNMKIEYRFKFYHISRYMSTNQQLDYLAKISDAKTILASVYSNKGEIGPENVIIYDKDKKEIKNDNQYLRDIQDEKSYIFFGINNNSEPSSTTKSPEIKPKQYFNHDKPKNEIKSLFSKEINPIPDPKEVKIEQKPLSSFNDPKKDIKETHSNQHTKKKSNFKPKIVEIEKSPDPKSKEKSKLSEPEEDSKTHKPKSSTVTIHFNFEETNDEQFTPFNKKVDLNTTINEIREEIKNEYKIDKKITIEYKGGDTKTDLGKKKQIKDIINDIKEESKQGETKYVLYIKITEKSVPKQNKKAIDSTAEPTTESEFKPKPKDDKETPHHNITSSDKINNNNNDNDSDSQHDDFVPNKKTKKKANLRKFKPTKRSMSGSPLPNSQNKANSNKQNFNFILNDSEKEIKLDINSLLEDNEQKIKNKFGIDEYQELDFFIIKKDHDETKEKVIENKKQMMESLKDYKIKIYLRDDSDGNEESNKSDQQQKSSNSNENQGKESNQAKSSNANDAVIDENHDSDANDIQDKDEEVKSDKYKYYYQTNKMDDIQEIELPKGADVRELKSVIAKENKVEDLSNIKVIFAGKDLINKLVLEDLEIGDIPLYIYIRSLEDILLMTAKALVIKKEDLDNIEEEEEDLDHIEEEEEKKTE